MKLGERIRAIRIAKGYKTQTAFADACSISQGLLSDIESGNVEAPRLDTLEKIAATLGVSVSELTHKQPEKDGLDWFWRVRLHALTPEAIHEHRGVPPEARGAWAIKQLLNAFSASEISERLSFSVEHLHKLASGRAIATQHVREQLEKQADAPGHWLETGDPGAVDSLLQQFLTDPDVGGWLALFGRTSRAGLGPDVFEDHLDHLLNIHKKLKTPAE